MSTNEDEFTLIFRYTREQAIAGGVLVDISDMAKEAGFKWPVAVTLAVWHEVVTPTPHDEREGQSKEGRLWDILNMARLAAKANKDDSDAVLFKVLVQRGGKQETVTLKLVLSAEAPEGGPCLTIMLPNED
jgi:hypothetical protein